MSLSSKQLVNITHLHRDVGAPSMMCLSVGTVRSGKTYSAALGFMLGTQKLKEPRRHLIIGRKQRVMDEEIVPTLKLAADAVGAKWHFTRHNQRIQAGTQTYIMAAGNDERSLGRIQGLSCHSLLADEATLLPEPFFNMAMSRLMYTTSRAWVTCNPSFPRHWLKKKWIDTEKVHPSRHLQFTFRDNPSLTPDVIARYESLFTGVFKQRMINGLWCAAEGLIYPQWQEKRAYQYLEEGYKLRVINIGVDYGTASPTVFIPLQEWWRPETVELRYHVEDMLYIPGGATEVNDTDSELAEKLVGFAAAQPLEVTSVVQDPSASSFRTTLIKLPSRTFKVRMAKTVGTLLPGIQTTNNLFRLGMLTVNPLLTELVEELGSYAWDEDKDDKPVKEHDHALDALRYVVMDRVRTQGINTHIALPPGM